MKEEVRRVTIIVTHLTIEQLCELYNLLEDFDCPIDHDLDNYLYRGSNN